MSVLQEEVLVWDGNASKAWCLNATAARVFQACDGATTRAEVATRLGEGGEDLLALTLADLSDRGLLAQPGPWSRSPLQEDSAPAPTKSLIGP